MESTTGLQLLKKYKNYGVTFGIMLMVPLAYAATNSADLLTSSDTFVVGDRGTTRTLLASSTILTAEIPGLTYNTIERARKGTVEDSGRGQDSFIFTAGNKSFKVNMTATTTFYTAEGNISSFNSLKNGSLVYVFGFIRTDEKEIIATKVVFANKLSRGALR